MFIGILQNSIENDRVFRDLFREFNERFSKMNDVLNQIDKESKLNHTYTLSLEQEAVIQDYLNLCAEEYLWYTKKRLPKSVWTSWRIGMIYYFNIKPIQKVINKQRDQFLTYYGLFDDIWEEVNIETFKEI